MDSPVSLWQIPQDVFTRVKIGLADRTSAQVLSGLAVGDQVIVGVPTNTDSAARSQGGGRSRGLFGFRL